MGVSQTLNARHVKLYFGNAGRPLTGASIVIKVMNPSQKFIIILVFILILFYSQLERCLILSKNIRMSDKKGVGFPKC